MLLRLALGKNFRVNLLDALNWLRSHLLLRLGLNFSFNLLLLVPWLTRHLGNLFLPHFYLGF